ncbi:MAG TPA: NAD-dependent epimerase/dehydratase family protein [Xanthobacteraceae bacterium]|nr:NAD-dependent epimerase/dehydratase family protein [Xanthobacteraceae bacterium]
MATLLCFGLGYSAEHFVREFGEKFDRIIGTVRSAGRAAELKARLNGCCDMLVFDGASVTTDLERAIEEAAYVLVSAPPDENGDPVLAACGDALAKAAHVRSIVYLSTIGVYGDFGGAWVDEATPVHPGLGRGDARLTAERAWQNFGARHGAAVAVLRLAGIYGPGQNALGQIERGSARRIAKPGQVFNRIHVADIAQAIDAAFVRGASGIFNVVDDEPTPSGDPIAFAAELMGLAPPPEIPFEQAAPSMSPMALSFWQECRRVRNDKLKRELGVVLRYPTYREGLRALFVSR